MREYHVCISVGPGQRKGWWSMFDSIHVFLLCVASALFISWVMTLKREIISLLAEAERLRAVVHADEVKASHLVR